MTDKARQTTRNPAPRRRTSPWRWLLGNTLVLACLMLVLWAAVSLVLRPRLTEMLSQAVRRELSLPQSAMVELDLGSSAQTLGGFLPGFHVDSTSAILDDIEVGRLRFDATAVDFNMQRILDGDKAEITSIGAATLTLQIPADALRARLLPLLEEEGIADARMELLNDAVRITGVRKANMAAQGQFYITDENLVGFRLTDFQFKSLSVTVSNLTLLVDDFLPRLNLGGMFAQVVIDELSVTPEYLEVTAHADQIDALAINGDALDVFKP